MASDIDSWLMLRAQALSRLEDHLQAGKIDHDIVDFLVEFNRDRECMFTTSSCSGRIVVLRGKDIFDKQGSEIIDVSHTIEGCPKVINRVTHESENPGILTWISLQPPILHIAARTLSVAESIVKCGRKAGFIRTCYKKMKSVGYHVEIAAHDKLHVVLPADKRVLLNLCKILKRYKDKLKILIDCLLGLTCTDI